MRNIFLTLLLLPLLVFAGPQTIVYNVTDDKVVQGTPYGKEVSIASISKLMTIYTVLQAGQNLNEKLTVTGNKINNTKLKKGMVLTRRELINMSLISSDNLAAMTLAKHYPGGMTQFVREMNSHSKELGMINTGFVEPTGLSPMNYSTAGDIVQLTKAVSGFSIVQEAAQTQKIITNPETVNKKHKSKSKKKSAKEPAKKKSTKLINNPTSHYFGYNGIITIKTGFTNAAGFCITMLLYVDNQLYNITVLGARTKQERELLVKKSLQAIHHT
jgi:D-alanyl-D-alanine endopeptidase (penicillin-binding protein 7)